MRSSSSQHQSTHLERLSTMPLTLNHHPLQSTPPSNLPHSILLDPNSSLFLPRVIYRVTIQHRNDPLITFKFVQPPQLGGIIMLLLLVRIYQSNVSLLKRRVL